MDSIWTKDVTAPEFPMLDGDYEAEAVIIGGGLAGLLTASFLHRAGVEAAVIEAGRIGSGQTAGTTAKLTAQHGLKYHQLTEDFGPDGAAQYARVQLEAVERLRRLTKEWHIDCDFEDCDTFLYTTGAPGPLEQEYEACRTLGMDVFLTHDTELPFSAMALGLRHQARFHPLKLLYALSDGLRIYEHSRVLDVEEGRVMVEGGSITAQSVIFACHYPFLNKPGYFFARQHQERSYVLALEGTAAMKHCYLGAEENGLSFRSWGKYLLLGGGSHRTGDNRRGGQYEALRQAARRYWPQCREVAAWSAQDCMPMDGVPYIGQYAESRPNWFVATGFQKWGMSTSVAAAEILSALALGRTPPSGSAVFAPQRFKVGASAQQLAEDAACSLKGLGKRLLEPGPASHIPPGHGGIAEVDGEKLGVYRDEKGEVHTVSPKCPHLGCQLEWNPEEKSWDCPCHGSRFDIYGRLLTGPAQTNLAK